MVLRLGAFESQVPDDCAICTRSGWKIPELEEPLPSHPFFNDVEQFTRFYLHKFVGLKVRSKSEYPYNCVGMVFSSRRAAINPSYLNKILQEDNYRPISRNEVQVGDVVVYSYRNELSHVGIILKVELIGQTPIFTVMSKWGDVAPEFVHLIDQVPEVLGEPIAFYTDRVGT